MSATLAARARSDATLSMPVRRPAGRRAAPSMPGRLLRWFGRRPGRGLLVLLFAAVSVLIILNAVLFQKGRHPAPMLSPPQSAARPAEQRRVEAPAVAEPVSPAAAPQAVMPPARPGTLAPAARDAAPRPPAPVAAAPQPRQAQAAPAPARPAPAAQPAARDPIADLINGADIRPPADIRGHRR
ncbi:hypothetical protein SAMN05428997_10341 [Bosea sp. CRIB-10]|uniref:hypothetical protein n=1 Tax=Bosea sp. CRIB-10 TaxID=378404 RepID=UPI0008F1B62E|nr:hypothetical protein [Bosea sp. CRIB-10]SFB93284.1 hypothetical protein SAMN05428997_10341 [Bosea sp. CRIB-10]